MAKNNKYMEKVLSEIIVATSNIGKFKEIERILKKAGIKAILIKEKVEIEEKGSTFLENAYLKAKQYYKMFRKPVLADDSGIIAKALGDLPGIYSSRFYSIDFGGVEAPVPDKDTANIRKLLRLLKDKKDRNAYFEAYIVLLIDSERGIFTRGICKGVITETPKGNKGFGYDPIFVPEGRDKTMAEMDGEEKDEISHRGKALKALIDLILKFK